MVNAGGDNLEKEVTTIPLKESSPGHCPSFYLAIYLLPTEFICDEQGFDLNVHLQAPYMHRRHLRVTWVIR